MSTRRRLLPALVLAAAAVLGFTGCAAPSASTGGADAAAESGPVDTGGGEAAGQQTGAADPAVVITGSIVITVDDPIAAADDATGIVEDAGGRISGRQEYAAGEYSSASAELTLRVPADQVEAVRTALASLGTLAETSLESTDVSASQRDLHARITTLRTSISRYNEWLGTASRTSDLIELESEIASRQSELETLEAEQRSLEDRVSMSTIALHLTEEYVEPQTAPADFGEAVAFGWHGFAGFWTQLALVLAVGLPWIVLLAALAVATVWFVRRRARRRAADALPGAPRLAVDHLLGDAPGGPGSVA
ncbi:DUF4349 domain-containing protein [Microbacterium tumbae]